MPLNLSLIWWQISHKSDTCRGPKKRTNWNWKSDLTCDQVARHEDLGEFFGVFVFAVPDGVVFLVEFLPEVGDRLGFFVVGVEPFKIFEVEGAFGKFIEGILRFGFFQQSFLCSIKFFRCFLFLLFLLFLGLFFLLLLLLFLLDNLLFFLLSSTTYFACNISIDYKSAYNDFENE